MQKCIKPVGGALGSTGIKACWNSLCYGFGPSLSLTLPSNSPVMHGVGLKPGSCILKFKVCNPLEKESERRCGSLLCSDLF